MVFHRAKHKNYRIKIEINQVFIQQVKHTQFLGVIFDDKLDWSNFKKPRWMLLFTEQIKT